MAHLAGFEPTTPAFGGQCGTGILIVAECAQMPLSAVRKGLQSTRLLSHRGHLQRIRSIGYGTKDEIAEIGF